MKKAVPKKQRPYGAITPLKPLRAINISRGMRHTMGSSTNMEPIPIRPGRQHLGNGNYRVRNGN